METIATLCSGIGAPEVASAGFMRPIWHAEIEPFPCAVLAHHWPDVPNLGDIMAPDFVERALAAGRPDVLVAGTPCQSFSVAGKREGLGDARGNLTLRFCEIVEGLDDGSLVILWENVPGILSDRTNGFGCLLAALAGEDSPIVPRGGRWTDAGLVIGPQRAAAWRILDAQFHGLAQRRRRVFVVASADPRICPEEILFEQSRSGGNFEKGREAGKNTSPTLEGRSGRSGATNFHTSGGLAVAATLTQGAESGGRGGYAGRRREDDVNLVPALCASGRGVERTGESRGQDPLVVCPTLRAGGNETGGHRPPGTDVDTCESLQVVGADSAKWAKGSGGPSGDECQNLVAIHGTQDPCVSDIAFALGRNSGQENAIAHTLRGEGHDASEDGTGRGVPLVPCGAQTFNIHSMNSCAMKGDGKSEAALKTNVARALDSAGFTASQGGTVVAETIGVRRLMPIECERLQGFPDNFTAINGAKDSPRYRAIGNSMAVPCVRWILERIVA